MKYIKYSKKNILLAVGCLFLTTACEKYLDFPYPGSTLAVDAFIVAEDAIYSVNSAYGPLQWEFNGGYFFEWYFGDVCSDDALKGGESLEAGPDLKGLENFQISADNSILDLFYRAQYVGAFRANFSLENVSKMDPTLFAAGLQNRCIGEALFLRAMYHFRLLRIFGGIPIADRCIYVQSEWQQPRASEADVYSFIIKDLKQAIALLPTQNTYKAVDMGRASKGAARALLMKVYMNTGQYDEAKLQGDSIMTDPTGYTLLANYNQNFDVNYENNKESLFEIQYVDAAGDYGSSNYSHQGATRSGFTMIFTRPRWAQPPAGITGISAGWGWNRPTQELYNEFEAGDMRRDAAIINPQGVDSTKNGYCPFEYYDLAKTIIDTTSSNLNQYLGNRYHERKYAEMNADTTFAPMKDNNPHGTLNHKEIRFSDVLLMHAEACIKSSSPNLAQAKADLERVRARARAWSGGGALLPPFPNYSVPLECVGGTGIKQLQDNAEDLMIAIQHERRVELAMEGHRWFDLKRWGILDVVMNNYKATTKPHIGSIMSPFVKGKNELFPIPQSEIDLNPMSQNPGY